MHRPRLIPSLAALGSSLVLAASLAMPASAARSGLASASTDIMVAQGHASPGATVSLYAWPPGVDASLKPGQMVPRKLLASTKATSAGTYSLLAPTAALDSNADAQGYVNLEADSGLASWFFIWSAGGHQNVLAASGQHPATVNVVSSSHPDEYCTGWDYRRQAPASYAIVGQAYILDPATHVTVGFTYASGQESSLGIGISNTNEFGSFTADGTNSQSSSSTQGFPSYGVGKEWFRTYFKIAHYRKDCSWGMPIQHHYRYMIKSNAWKGGDNTLHPSTAPRAPNYNCIPEEKGSKFSTHEESAVNWSRGLTITAVGFDGNAHTGYDHSAVITFKFHANRYVCGTNNAPPIAKQLVAKKSL